MHKIETTLKYFRFNSTNQHGPYEIIWYILDNEEEDEFGRCFSKEEMEKFLNFIAQNPDNFPGDKNYFICDEESDDIPFCGIFSSSSDENLQFPSNLILRASPQLNEPGAISSCMDIILTNSNGTDNHIYNLNFSVIGKIKI